MDKIYEKISKEIKQFLEYFESADVHLQKLAKQIDEERKPCEKFANSII